MLELIVFIAVIICFLYIGYALYHDARDWIALRQRERLLNAPIASPLDHQCCIAKNIAFMIAPDDIRINEGVLILRGLEQSKESIMPFMCQFRDKGYDVYTIDRTKGRSALQIAVQIAEQWSDIQKRENWKSTWLVGHSYGGLLASLIYTTRSDLFTGALFVSPFWGLSVKPHILLTERMYNSLRNPDQRTAKSNEHVSINVIPDQLAVQEFLRRSSRPFVMLLSRNEHVICHQACIGVSESAGCKGVFMSDSSHYFAKTKESQQDFWNAFGCMRRNGDILWELNVDQTLYDAVRDVHTGSDVVLQRTSPLTDIHKQERY